MNFKLAGDIPFEFEAAVAGGIPIINTHKRWTKVQIISNLFKVSWMELVTMLTRMINDGINMMIF